MGSRWPGVGHEPLCNGRRPAHAGVGFCCLLSPLLAEHECLREKEKPRFHQCTGLGSKIEGGEMQGIFPEEAAGCPASVPPPHPSQQTGHAAWYQAAGGRAGGNQERPPPLLILWPPSVSLPRPPVSLLCLLGMHVWTRGLQQHSGYARVSSL